MPSVLKPSLNLGKEMDPTTALPNNLDVALIIKDFAPPPVDSFVHRSSAVPPLS